MPLKTIVNLLPGLLFLLILGFPPVIAAQPTLSESDVVALLERMDRYSNQREFGKLESLISTDARFALINKDIDEENTVIIGYDDYFDGIAKIMSGVDEYRITRDIVKIELNAERTSARVLTRTVESVVSDGVEDFDRSTGWKPNKCFQ